MEDIKTEAKILIVDDSPANVEILEERLEDYELEIATSGEEALEKVSCFNPDIVLLDIMMPGMNGYEVCRTLRKDPQFKNIKIIMVSGKAILAERLEGYNSGADDYITKPFDGLELLAKIRVYIRLKYVEELDSLKTDLLTLLTHETSTPLNTIVGPLEMLIQEKMEPDEMKKWLKMAYNSTLNLQHLHKNIMTFCTMKSGKSNFNFENSNFCTIIRDAIINVSSQAKKKNIAIQYYIPNQIELKLDRMHISKVITRLLENAVHYSNPDGEVTIDVSTNNHSAVLTVVDNGAGISPDFLPNIFNVFSVADIEHHTGNHSLQLAIAWLVLQAHNGSISVESELGVKTVFTVCLPQ